MRDLLVHEDNDRLVLLPGVGPEWFRDLAGMSVQSLGTHFGSFGFEHKADTASAVLRLTDTVSTTGG